MRIAHVIMAHKDPVQLERVIKSMDHPQFYFFIHLDLKSDFDEYAHLSKIDRVVFIKNRVHCNWGGFSFVNAILSSLTEILRGKEPFDFFNLVSGQDYPIKPADKIYNFYKKNMGKCFISYDVDPERRWWTHAVERAERYHFTDLNFKGRYLLQRLFNACLPKRTFPLKMELYGSSNSSWWTITSDCAGYIVNFMSSNPRLQKFMKYTWGSDEFLIATIIMNSPYKDKVINNNMRFITWMDGHANPRILTENDYDAITASDNLFARKFDAKIDAVILDKLDKFIKQ